MQTFYLRKDVRDFTRKILVDMAFLNAHKIIRFPKYLFEDGLYILYREKGNDNLSKHFLESAKAKKEDKDFYYFPLPFKPNQVENI